MKTKDEEIANILNEHYKNIIEKSGGLKPSEINYNEATDKRILINNIIKKFKGVVPRNFHNQKSYEGWAVLRSLKKISLKKCKLRLKNELKLCLIMLIILS